MIMAKCSVEWCGKQSKAKGLCGAHWLRAKQGKSLTEKTVYEKTPAERFRERYTVMPSGCWHWDSIGDKGRAGKFSINGEAIYASRASFILHKGDPGKLHVCHTCDNGLCVNPDHLFLGTHLDNMRDMVQKGRKPKGRETNTFLGSSHPTTKLSESDVLEMRASSKSMKDLASQYGISYSAVYAIIQRRNWKHI